MLDPGTAVSPTGLDSDNFLPASELSNEMIAGARRFYSSWTLMSQPRQVQGSISMRDGVGERMRRISDVIYTR